MKHPCAPYPHGPAPHPGNPGHGRKARLFIAEFRKDLVKIGRRAFAPKGRLLMAHDPEPFPQSGEMRYQLGVLALADGG